MSTLLYLANVFPFGTVEAAFSGPLSPPFPYHILSISMPLELKRCMSSPVFASFNPPLILIIVETFLVVLSSS